MFRFLLKFRRDEFFTRHGHSIKKDDRRIENEERSLDYLGRYFDRRKFDVEWNDLEAFIQSFGMIGIRTGRDRHEYNREKSLCGSAHISKRRWRILLRQRARSPRSAGIDLL